MGNGLGSFGKVLEVVEELSERSCDFRVWKMSWSC